MCKPEPNVMIKFPLKTRCEFSRVTPVFPKVDHSANVARIVLLEQTIGSLVDLNFW